jgi:hypothetical protein
VFIVLGKEIVGMWFLFIVGCEGIFGNNEERLYSGSRGM